jgi:hypothetical protein
VACAIELSTEDLQELHKIVQTYRLVIEMNIRVSGDASVWQKEAECLVRVWSKIFGHLNRVCDCSKKAERKQHREAVSA